MAFAAFSQNDTLLLKITELKKAKIVVQFKGQAPLGEEGVIALSSNPWFLKVSTINGAKIIVTNTEGDGTSKELLSQSKTYTIKDDIIVENNLRLEKNFKIDINSKDNGEVIKSYQLSKTAAAVSTNIATTTSTPDVTPAADYKPGSMVLDALYLANGTSLGLKAKILAFYGLEKPPLHKTIF